MPPDYCCHLLAVLASVILPSFMFPASPRVMFLKHKCAPITPESHTVLWLPVAYSFVSEMMFCFSPSPAPLTPRTPDMTLHDVKVQGLKRAPTLYLRTTEFL